MNRRHVALGAAGLTLGVAAELASYRSGELDRAVADLLVGWVLIGCGLAVWKRRGGGRVGPLLASSGVAWFLGSFATPALYLHRGPLVHALLSFPSGRLSGPIAPAVVGLVYLDGAIEPVGRSAIVTLVLCGVIAAAAIAGYVSETGARRRSRRTSSAGAVAVAVVLGFGAIGRLAGWGTDAATLWAYETVLVVFAVGLLADLLRGRGSQGVLTGLVVDLGGLWEPVTLRDRLALALGDRSLQLGYWVGGEAGYVDEAGQPLLVPSARSERSITLIEREGEPVAVLLHDPAATLRDRALLDAVAAATRLAVSNVRLQAEVTARVEQVAASRRRIVEAADAQRRELARELHDGAERRLAAVFEQLAALEHLGDDEARELLEGVETQLEAAREELGELARGIHPAALTGGGLSAALPELAARAPLPVEVRVKAGRCSAAVEACAYFVCAEALANIAKYADASRVQIDVGRDRDRLVVVVVDDGAGGADPSSGSGLRGLVDRVQALGGQFTITSPVGCGTRLVAEIPIRDPSRMSLLRAR